MAYYKATMKRGHVGSGREDYITFYYECANAVKAMQLAQRQGGTKHSEIPPVVAITKEEYEEAMKIRSAYRRTPGVKEYHPSIKQAPKHHFHKVKLGI